MVGLVTANQNSSVGNFFDHFCSVSQADDSDDDDDGPSAETVLNFDFFHSQKRLVPLAPDELLGKFAFIFQPATMLKSQSGIISLPLPFLVPASAIIAQTGLSPRAPAVV